MIDNCKFVQATRADFDEVLSLYKSLLGTEGCAWDDEYPGPAQIDFDLSREALFVLKNESGQIIATISIDDDPFVKNLDFWKFSDGLELSRLGVLNDYRNKGIAKKMIEYASQEILKRGGKSVRYLVYKENGPAINSYKNLGFEKRGECRLFEEDFYCYEKSLV